MELYLKFILNNKKFSVAIKQQEPFYVGRSKICNIQIQDTSVSNMHAEFYLDSKGLIRIKDLNSTNGVFINDQRIESRGQNFFLGDKVQMGDVFFTIDEDRNNFEHFPLLVREKNNIHEPIDLTKTRTTSAGNLNYDSVLDVSDVQVDTEGICLDTTYIKKAEPKVETKKPLSISEKLKELRKKKAS